MDALTMGELVAVLACDARSELGLVRTGLTEDRYVSAVEVREVNDIPHDKSATTVGGRYVFGAMSTDGPVFKTLDEVMKPGAILASNTSTLDLNKIASFTKRPQDVIGMHFFSPANVMKLLEVIRGEKTAKDVLATVMQLGKKIKKTTVVSGVCDGFIGNRMIEQYSRQAGFLLEEGATPQQVDKAMEKFGMAMGPFRMGDLAELEVVATINEPTAGAHPERADAKRRVPTAHRAGLVEAKDFETLNVEPVERRLAVPVLRRRRRDAVTDPDRRHRRLEPLRFQPGDQLLRLPQARYLARRLLHGRRSLPQRP